VHSKWTAVTLKNKEKHFLVTEVEFDDERIVVGCILEAVMSNRAKSIDWKNLKNSDLWKQGWK